MVLACLKNCRNSNEDNISDGRQPPIVRSGGRSGKTIGETIKRDLDLNS